MASLTGEIQSVAATVLGMLDGYRALIGFLGRADLAWRVGDVTRMAPCE